MNNIIKGTPGAELTIKLHQQRLRIVNEIAAKGKSVSLLTEGSKARVDLELEIEQIQLNEMMRQRALLARALRTDIKSRIIKECRTEIRKIPGLTSEQHDILEARLLYEVGFWNAVQSGIGNFAGGVDSVLKKIKLKKEPEGWEEAQRIFTKIAEKEGNQVVKDLVKAIDQETNDLESGLGSGDKDKQFPVNKHADVFQTGVNTIASVYDSVVAATEKNPDEDGYMPVEVANEIIEQLRIIVNKYMSDTEREKGGMYASFGGGGETLKAEALLREQEEAEAEEVAEIDPDEEFEKIMRGQESPVFKRMTSLKAPLVIAGTGVALGALGWMANMPWFQDWVLELLNIPKTETVTSIEQVMEPGKGLVDEVVPNDFGAIKPGEGVARFVQRTAGQDGGFDLVSKNASLDDLRKAAMKVGGGNLEKGLEGIAATTQGGGDPKAALEAMRSALADPSAVGAADGAAPGSLWKLWSGPLSGKGGTIFQTMVGTKLKGMLKKKVMGVITKEVSKQVVKKGGTAAAASAVAMMSGAGAVLAGIGVGAVVAGGTLAYIRNRAKKKSRMGVLNDLLDKLVLLEPKPVPVEPTNDVDVTITLKNPPEGVSETYRRVSLLEALGLSETTEIEIDGLEGDEDLEATGGKIKMSLKSIDTERYPPKVTDIDDLPGLDRGLTRTLPGLDLEDEAVTVTIDDQRTEPKKEKPEAPKPEEEKPEEEKPEEEKPEEETLETPVGEPPVPVKPSAIEKGNHAVVVFDDGGAEVWRILKKKTYRKYASDARRSKDKDAKKFASRYKDYDSILSGLRADGVFVNTDEVESELSKISSGPEGKKWRAEYTRTRKSRKTGKTTRKKSVTGGYTDAGDVSSLADIRKNIKGANNRIARGASKFTVIYLVGKGVVDGLKKAGLSDSDAKQLAQNAINMWADTGKKPKIADLGASAEAGAVLKSTSLAEAFTNHRQAALVDVDVRFFRKVMHDLRMERLKG